METYALPQINEAMERIAISTPRSKYASLERHKEPDYVTFKDVSAQIAAKQNELASQAAAKMKDDAQIYSDTSILIKKQHVKSEKELMEEGLKKLSDKYESLERVKPKLNNAMPGCVYEGHTDDSVPSTEGQQQQQQLQQMSSEDSGGVRSPSPVPVDHNPNENGLSDQDILQAEMFYRSHKSEVFVCPTLANLYFGSVKTSGPVDLAGLNNWEYVRTGIPVLVLDSGESRRERKLHIILAERGTGFTLWRDQINHLTNYSAPHVSYHTMHLSSDHTRIAGFSYDDSGAACDFLRKIMELTSDPDDDILNLSRTGKHGKKSKDKKMTKKKYKAPIKADISQPCCFTHITKIDRPEECKETVPPKVMPLPPKMNHMGTASIQRRHSGIRQEQMHVAPPTATH